jgi:cellulose synthase/poly-beta-1,6-N-acetylglucosamine synthase-like glycosyltransferase
MFAETRGGRASWDTGYGFSAIFSLDFYRRVFSAGRTIAGLFRQINLIVLALAIFVGIVAVVLYFAHRKKDTENSYFRPFIYVCISSVVAFIFVAALSAFAGLQYAGFMRSTYAVFFFVILGIAIATLYVHEKLKLFRFVLPLITVVVILLATNTTWPFVHSNTRTAAMRGLMTYFIETIVEADGNGETEITLSVPRYPTDNNWPFPMAWWGEAFSDTLYRHHVISRRITVTLEIDENMDEIW